MCFWEEKIFTSSAVAAAICRLKSGKVAGEDNIRSEMLKALSSKEIIWLLECVMLRGSLAKHRENCRQA